MKCPRGFGLVKDNRNIKNNGRGNSNKSCARAVKLHSWDRSKPITTTPVCFLGDVMESKPTNLILHP